MKVLLKPPVCGPPWPSVKTIKGITNLDGAGTMPPIEMNDKPKYIIGYKRFLLLVRIVFKLITNASNLISIFLAWTLAFYSFQKTSKQSTICSQATRAANPASTNNYLTDTS